MYGQPPTFRPGCSGRGAMQQPQLIHLNSSLFPNGNLFINPGFMPHLNPFLRNPNNFPPLYQQFPTDNFPIPMNSDTINFQTPRPNYDNNNSNISKFPQQQSEVQNEMIGKMDKAVTRATQDLLASNKNVSAWEVSQAALLMVKAESWESLGFQMQQVPSLNLLLVTEGKINAFIHCFVAVRRMTSLYDLDVAICENEGIERFEELELGPLVKHPLAVHYFSVTSEVTEVYRIRTEELISYLCEFIDTHKRKEVQVDGFLDFVSMKQSISGREKLCVRIQNIGIYISNIKRVRQEEDIVLQKCLDKTRKRALQRTKKRPLFSAQKKQLDDNFNSISQRIKFFSSETTQFGGKHIRFVSSSSEDDCSEDTASEDNRVENNTGSNCNSTLPNVRSDRLSSCPYPSATEEKTRLGLKSDDSGGRCSVESEKSQRKRKFENTNSTILPYKLPKRKKKDSNNQDINGHSLSNESIKLFTTTWKEACRGNNAEEVLERMLQTYNIKKTKKVKALFTSFPFIGLLNVAVICIKFGMWDNMYDSFQTFSKQSADGQGFESASDYISIDVEPAKKDMTVSAQKILTHKHGVKAEDIAKKISGYFEVDILSFASPSGENKFIFLRKLCKCEYWLSEQYSIDKFESLGYGEYFMFLDKYMHLLPFPLQKCLIGDIFKKDYLEAYLLPLQFDVLLSQALNSLWENETVNLQNISDLLARQFPLVCFKPVKSDLKENVGDILREKLCSLSSKCVLFSSPLLVLNCMADSLAQNEKRNAETSGFGVDTGLREGMIGPVTTKDAIDVLCKAPMLTDLNLWSHWDHLFAPSLGSMVEWLLNEVNTKELLFLVTKDATVIRIDHSATMDSLLKVFIKGSAFETAVQLLSLFALHGGERNVPLSLLKCHARQAFETIINNSLEMELYNKNLVMHGKPSCDQHIVEIFSTSHLDSKLPNNRTIHNRAVSVMSRFVLDCLGYLPIEFCSFAADVLVAGMQFFVKDSPSAILSECKQVEQRVMLHEVGMSLGLVEWIADYHSFHFSATEISPGSSCLYVVNSEYNTRLMIVKDMLNKQPSSSGEMLVPSKVDSHDVNSKRVSNGSHLAETEVDSQTAIVELSTVDNHHMHNDPARVIESIRQEEFGLDQCLSATENKMLEKQHARLGRALHCLSQELYSQDSHFLLELVQNADDNIYLENVEPTLTFILQRKYIIVLNNEQGFSAENIRALCDVGNSTKKGRNAGYIGKKGIGFKSVFRVTDAPEIHSNGFHIKFDITEGQIGFVLPTVVPPCDMNLYARLASADADLLDCNSWNTCIVLPFKSTLSEGFAMNNIISMFSDLHPSLLLFLHRLQCIKFRNILDDSLIVMRKQVLGDGIVEVSLGNEKMTWLVMSQKLQADVIRSDVEITEISIAFTLQETGDEGYAPILNLQPVFAFLPLRTYGLKFILQGDFVLPSSREEIDVNSSWNQWLLSEFPDLFVSAEMAFCDLPCYRGSPGKAVTTFMSFVPLLGEVHGFFSSLPRMIISKLRMSNCLLLDFDEKEWVPPCKVLRNWTDQTRSLLPDNLISEHLGLGFLNKDIVLSDSLARALGVEEYGPKILVGVISSLCRSANGLKSMGLSWLSSWLSAVYVMSSHSFMQASAGFETESDFIFNLQKTPFIPLSDGQYGSVYEDSIWLHSEVLSNGATDDCVLKAFPKLYAKLRIVSPNLLAAATTIENSCSDTTVVENVTRMLYKIGVQRLSAHEIVKVHILPFISDDKDAMGQEDLMIEYLSFAMFHLQSSCNTCSQERGGIMTELREKALILTNFGYHRSNEVPIHFSRMYENPIDMNKLISGVDVKWHEIDTAYLKHPITKSISGGELKWRNFFKDMGVTDFVQIVQVEKNAADMSLVDNEYAVWGKDVMSMDVVVKDWDSEELFCLLSWLSKTNDWEKSKYLLEILDILWDDYFSDKVSGYCIDSTGESKPFKSSVIRILQDIPWMMSNIDKELHYPKELFHDCVAVNSVLGVSAPYTIPKVKSKKLLADIGLKSLVTLDDALSVLRLWRRSESPFKASVSQMSNFYAFLWKGMPLSKQKIIEELLSGPYIFVPYASCCSHDEAVPGALLSPEDVCWCDTIISLDQIKSDLPECVTGAASCPIRNMLYNFYPNLHDFFVKDCGVSESPPFCSYLQILLQLSTISLPHQAGKRVFEVFLRWTDALKSGSLSSEDVGYLKESLLKKEYTVLPTRHDKWVSLHASFGLICWSDDNNLGKEFKHFEGIDFLYFGEFFDEENQMLQSKISIIMQKLGIPALSEIVTREAIYYGPGDCSLIFSLMNWILPYAQRYILNAHPDKYFQLKQSGFQDVRHLKIVAVEKLYYQNAIKRCKVTSKRRHKCDCLLQDNILYFSRGSDSHTIFMEFSRLLYNGNPDLHFANFLHMITTMAESGAAEEQTEFFILNSQKVPKLPAGEFCWSLESDTVSLENNPTLAENSLPLKVEQNYSMSNRRPINSNWPPVDWKTAPGFKSVNAFGLKKPAAGNLQITGRNVAEQIAEQIVISETEFSKDFNVEDDPMIITPGASLLNAEFSEFQSNHSSILVASEMNEALDSVDNVAPDIMNFSQSNSTDKEQLFGQQEALLTGRIGELTAFKYFVGKLGDALVNWVNETRETGLPYDIIIGGENSREYIEVKATKAMRKNWFLISMREWQFAIEKGESFSIAHVTLSDSNLARVTIYKNPARLCQLGNLKLAVVVPKT